VTASTVACGALRPPVSGNTRESYVRECLGVRGEETPIARAVLDGASNRAVRPGAPKTTAEALRRALAALDCRDPRDVLLSRVEFLSDERRRGVGGSIAVTARDRG
jgi:hypothetical protein